MFPSVSDMYEEFYYIALKQQALKYFIYYIYHLTYIKYWAYLV